MQTLRPFLLLAVAISLRAQMTMVAMQQPSAPCAASELRRVWSIQGHWKLGDADLHENNALNGRDPVPVSFPSSILLIGPGRTRRVECQASAADCKATCASIPNDATTAPAPTSLRSRRYTADFPEQLSAFLISQVGHRKEVKMFSRAAGWSDAIVGFDAQGWVDLSPVFIRSRPRRFQLTLCDRSGGACRPIPEFQWDGTSARAQIGSSPGSYRLMEGEKNEALLALVPQGDQEVQRAKWLAYSDALEALGFSAAERDEVRRLFLFDLEHVK